MTLDYTSGRLVFMRVSAALACLLYVTTANAQETTRYSTRPHPRANGVVASVAYPRLWKALDGSGTVLQVFVGEENRRRVGASIGAKRFVGTEQDCSNGDRATWEKLVQPSQQLISSAPNISTAKPGWTLETRQWNGEGAAKILTHARVEFSCHGNLLLSLSCFGSGFPGVSELPSLPTSCAAFFLSLEVD